MADFHVGVLAGIRSEADALVGHVPAALKVTVFLSGADVDHARVLAGNLVSAGATHLLSFGFAGGLDPAFKPGALLLPRTVSTEEGKRYFVDGEWHETAMAALKDLNPMAGSHLGVDRPVSGVYAKSQLFGKRRGVVAVDMESHVLAAAAETARLPLLIIRVVLDSAEHELPPAATASVKKDGSISILKVGLSVLRNPSQIGSLNRLARASRVAEDVLLGCGSRGGPLGFGLLQSSHGKLNMV